MPIRQTAGRLRWAFSRLSKTNCWRLLIEFKEMVPHVAKFAHTFRWSLHSSIEYSFAEDVNTFGTMVPGDVSLLTRLEEFVAGTLFGGDWLVAVSRIAEYVRPDAYLFKVDWCQGLALALTLYFRFPQPPDEATFKATMIRARPFRWLGPSPQAVAASLKVPGPRGMGVRMDWRGRGHVAVYYRVTDDVREFGPRLVQLLRVCGLPEGHAPLIEQDLRPLYAPGEVGVIGIDGGASEYTVGSLKLDPANVPFYKAWSFLAAKGVSAPTLAALKELSNTLRAGSLSYLGAKYNADGFAGWKAYFSTEPHRLPQPGRAFIQVDGPTYPVARMPHY
ncbi:MAG TPA: hypothetical protein VFA21_19490 [Pyrinomonadaceae bacterium]|nr:hypothetical protein [Pyrinomonadaceae bacterium]